MSKITKPRFSVVNRIALASGIACAACCAVPLIAILVGSATVAGLAIYSEKAAAAFAVLGISVLLFRRLKKKASSCDVDGSCTPDKTGAGKSENR